MTQQTKKIDKLMLKMSAFVANQIMCNDELRHRMITFAGKLFQAGKLPGITKDSSYGDIVRALIEKDDPIDIAQISGNIKAQKENKEWEVSLRWRAPFIKQDAPFELVISSKNTNYKFYKDIEGLKNASSVDAMKFFGGAWIKALVIAVDEAANMTVTSKPVMTESKLSDDELQFKTILDALQVNSVDELKELVVNDLKEQDVWDDLEDEYEWEIPMIIVIKGSKSGGIESVALERMPEADIGEPWEIYDNSDDYDDYNTCDGGDDDCCSDCGNGVNRPYL